MIEDILNDMLNEKLNDNLSVTITDYNLDLGCNTRSIKIENKEVKEC